MEKGFDLLVLNKDFEIVTLLNYTLLQWSRKYYESGYFSVEIPVESYSSEFKYIYSKDRPEIGKIEQVNYYIQNGYKSVTLSGYFLENELNRRVVYQYATTTNISNQPTWTIKSTNAEDLAFVFFNAFKDLTFTQADGSTYSTDLKISAGTSQSRGKASEHTRGNESLGNKINTILKPSKMSYRINYDFDTSEQTFECWIGKDRSQDNTDGNNPIIFSTRYGNITNADLLVATTDYKNSYLVIEGDYDATGECYVIAGNERATDDLDDSFFYMGSSENSEDYSSTSAYISAMRSEAHEELLENGKTLSLDFDTIESSYIYREDFDLGDICSIEIPDLGISEDAVLSGIYEVVKNGVWSMTLEFTI